MGVLRDFGPGLARGRRARGEQIFGARSDQDRLNPGGFFQAIAVHPDQNFPFGNTSLVELGSRHSGPREFVDEAAGSSRSGGL